MGLEIRLKGRQGGPRSIGIIQRMKFGKLISLVFVLGLAALFLAAAPESAKFGRPTASPQAERERFQKLYDEGNYKDAYDGFRKLALDANDDPLRVGCGSRTWR